MQRTGKRPRTSSIKRLTFPDVLNEQRRNREHRGHGDEEEDDDAWVSQVFFDLANADHVLYRIQGRRTSDTTNGTKSVKMGLKDDRDEQTLVFHQDMSACHQHTGGIIWETSYLLLEYLLEHCTTTGARLGRTLELGAGVGFLGQCLAAECGRYEREAQSDSTRKDDTLRQLSVTLTETAEVLVNVQANLTANRPILTAAAARGHHPHYHSKRAKPHPSSRTPNEQDTADSPSHHDPVIQACALDWTRSQADMRASEGMLAPHSFDTLLGTDVIFTPSLVEPLLQTAAQLSHDETIWYLCVQRRCAVSHQLFLFRAPSYGFGVCDITESVVSLPRCQWGAALECLVYRISRVCAAPAPMGTDDDSNPCQRG